jgi:ribosomal protein L14E/L6E/L27E
MEFARGLVVRSTAGRDRSGFLVVLQADAHRAVVCDGRRRSLEHPKKKNLKHLAATDTLLPESSLATNRGIRRALAAFRSGGPFSRRGG